MSRLYWARNDGIGGHVWLSEADQDGVAREMLVQGMAADFPVEKLRRGERMHVTVGELEHALEAASPEPVSLDPKLWSDWLAFLEGATRNGGLLVR